MANFLLGTVISLAAGGASSLFSKRVTRYQTVEKGKQESFQQPKSSYGDFIPKCWGRCRTAGILVWADEIREVVTTTTETQSSGGKGGGGQTTTTETQTYTYYGSFAAVLCETFTELEQLRFNGKLVWDHGDWRNEISQNGVRIYYGDGAQTLDPLLQAKIGERAIPYRRRGYIVIEDLDLTDFGNSYPQISAVFRRTHDGSTAWLDQTIKEICLQSVFLEENDIDVTELSGIEVSGYVINQELTIAEQIQALATTYAFDVVNTGNKIAFRPQYRAFVSAFIPDAKLASREQGQERPKQYTEEIKNISTLPSQYEVRFFDSNRNLLQGTAYSTTLQNAFHTNVEVFDYPGQLSDGQALTLGNRLLWVDWERSHTETIYLPPEYSVLEPNDVIEITVDGSVKQYQINRLELGANGQLIAKCWSYRAEIYNFQSTASAYATTTETATQGSPINLGTINGVSQVSEGATIYEEGTDYIVDIGGGTITPVVGGNISNGTSIDIAYKAPQTPVTTAIPTPVTTDLRILDIHQVYDSDPRGLYAFGYGSNGWSNASVYVSRNGGTSYDFAINLISRSIFGSVDTVLADGATGSLDTVNTVDVTATPYAELTSITIADLDNGKNRALIGDEIIGFQTATLLGTDGSGNRQYRLSNLYRGLRGTYGETAGHSGGEDFYLLSGYKVVLTGDVSDIGKTYYFKAISPGQVLNDVTAVAVTIQGNAFDEWIPRITGFSPVQGNDGTVVKIFGAGFADVTAVDFGGTAAQSFVVDSDSQITATVATGTTSGKIILTATGGTGASISEFIIGSGVNWGEISGMLSDQTDLQAALDAINNKINQCCKFADGTFIFCAQDTSSLPTPYDPIPADGTFIFCAQDTSSLPTP